MRALTADMIAFKNSLEGTNGPGVWIYELPQDDSTTSRYTNHQDSIVYDGETYTPKNVTNTLPSTDMSDSTTGFAISIANADNVEGALLRANKYANNVGVCRYVNVQLLSSALNKVEYRGIMLTSSFTDEAATINCGAYDFRASFIPSECVSRDHCRHEFKGAEGHCGYAGGVGVCDKLLTTCAVLLNEDRWGGVKNRPRERP